FLARRLLEAVDVHVSDAGTDLKVRVQAMPRDLISDDVELQRLIRTFTQDGDTNVRIPRPFQQVSNFSRGHVVSGFAVDSADDVTGTYSRTVSRRSRKRRDDNDLVVARPNGHAYAVVFTALVFAQLLVLL